MTMPKLSAEQKTAANENLARLDKAAQAIEANYEAWGLPFDVAKEVINQLDKQADAIEVATYGDESLNRRQVEVLKSAKVIQREADEPYMSAFESDSVVQQDADEPYMSAYGDDDSSGVGSGADASGRRLAPHYGLDTVNPLEIGTKDTFG